MAGIPGRAGLLFCLLLCGLFVSVSGQAGNAAETAVKDAGNGEAQARMEALRTELGTVSTALSEAVGRETALREQLKERAAQSASYEEALPDEESQALLARIKVLSAELDGLRLELKTRMEASESFKTRDNALRELHGQVNETRTEIRRLQQERSRLEVELKTLEDAAVAGQTEPSAPSEEQPPVPPVAGGVEQ